MSPVSSATGGAADGAAAPPSCPHAIALNKNNPSAAQKTPNPLFIIFSSKMVVTGARIVADRAENFNTLRLLDPYGENGLTRACSCCCHSHTTNIHAYIHPNRTSWLG